MTIATALALAFAAESCRDETVAGPVVSLFRVYVTVDGAPATVQCTIDALFIKSYGFSGNGSYSLDALAHEPPECRVTNGDAVIVDVENLGPWIE